MPIAFIFCVSHSLALCQGAGLLMPHVRSAAARLDFCCTDWVASISKRRRAVEALPMLVKLRSALHAGRQARYWLLGAAQVLALMPRATKAVSKTVMPRAAQM